MDHMLKRCAAGVCGLILCASFGQAQGVEALPFTDVPQEGPTAEAVRFVTQSGLMNGVGGALFEPDGTVTRAMVVTILHRFAGRPEGRGYNEFIDVADGAWYTDAIIWASNGKIVLGYGNGRYGTDDPVTRLQLATMLQRFAGLYGLDTTQRVDLTALYSDPSADYGDGATHESMQWACALELITPRTEGRVDAAQPATRLDVAQAVQRLAAYYGDEAFRAAEGEEASRTETVFLEEESTRGHIEVSYTVTFRYSDGTERDRRVESVFEAEPDALPEEVGFTLLRNYRKDGPDADTLYFEDCWTENCTGVTVRVDSLTFGRNTAYPSRYFRVNAGNYGEDRLMYDSVFYSGEVDVSIGGDLIQISCQNGGFTADTEIALVLARPVRGGTGR